MALRRPILLAILLAAGWVPAALAQTPTRLRGTVATLAGDTLTVTPPSGETVAVALRPDSVISAIIPANLADIRPGSFIGTAAVPGPAGSLVAIEVHVFPDSMRGLGEGHRPFDLRPESTMTNGTVGDVVGSNGHTLTVGYKGGQQTVMVPEGTPIVTFEPGTRAELAPGARVIVFASKAADGTLAAARVLVGKDGLVPPM